jgi:tetratricopeptide (TPR) repeat protein
MKLDEKHRSHGMAKAPRRGHHAAVLVFLAVGICAGALSAQNAAGGPEVQKIIQRGLEAVQARDEQSANLAFAQLRNQDGPRAYAEIARAEAKIPGRDRRVLCWFAAYLAADPKAPDSAEVTAEINRLDAEARGQITRLLAALQEAIVQSPWSDARNYEMRDMVGRWAGLGDFAAAKKVIDLIDDPNTKSDALTNLASAYCQLIHQQVDRGDMKGARASVAEAEQAWKQVPNFNTALEAQYYVASSWIGFARGQVRSADWKGAQESLATALKLNGNLTSPGDTNNIWDNVGGVQVAMAKGQIKAGDRDGARASIAAALQTADLLRNDPFREEPSMLQDIADVQLLAGDAGAAQKSLVRARDLTRDNVSLGYIAVDQAAAGNVTEARTTLELITDASTRSRFSNTIEHLHDEKPLLPPLPSDLVTAASVANAEAWTFLLNQELSSPVFTSFPNYSDLKAVATEILKEPVRNGPLPRTYLPLDQIRVLTLVTGHLLEAQAAIDSMWKPQFKP